LWATAFAQSLLLLRLLVGILLLIILGGRRTQELAITSPAQGFELPSAIRGVPKPAPLVRAIKIIHSILLSPASPEGGLGFQKTLGKPFSLTQFLKL
jgi:hypothetical protein